MPIMLATYSTNKIIVLKRYVSERRRTEDAQLSQRDRAAGRVIVFAKSRKLELGDNILQTL